MGFSTCDDCLDCSPTFQFFLARSHCMEGFPYIAGTPGRPMPGAGLSVIPAHVSRCLISMELDCRRSKCHCRRTLRRGYEFDMGSATTKAHGRSGFLCMVDMPG